MIRTEDHAGLTDLELLTGRSDALSPEQLDRVLQVRAHVSVCRECFDAARFHGFLKEKHKGATSTCPGEDVWPLFAAGLLEEAEAQERIRHVLTCVRCEQLWEAAREDVGTLEPDEELEQLESSTPAWQQKMAQTLAAGAGTIQAQRPIGKVLAFPRKLVWMSAAAAVLVLSVGASLWFGFPRRSAADSDNALLAQAYDAQRRTDLRLAGGAAVGKAAVDRGGSDQDPSAALMQLKLRVRQHLDRTPGDPYWIAMRGRVALLENDGRTARKNLELAKASGMTGLDADLAAAYFEIGEATNDSIAWYKAIDLYGKVIAALKGDKNSVVLRMAYFNQGVCYEHTSVPGAAVEAYRQALALETDPGWRKEIEERLRRAEARQKSSEDNRKSDPDLSPASLLSAERRDLAAVSREYELYLESATRTWEWSRLDAPAERRTALERLAVLGRTHQDAWPTEMLSSLPNPVAEDGLHHLEVALQASLRGVPDQALAEAETASLLFQSAGIVAGAIRADAERVYALQRTGKVSACLKLAKRLVAQPALKRYGWLQVYVMLEEASCRIDQMDVAGGAADTEAALSLARSAGLPLQALRAEGFLVAIYDMEGHTNQAWRLAQSGLEESMHVRGARMATYQFLSSLYMAAQTQGLMWTAASLAGAASEAASFTRNLAVQAYAHEVKGTALTAVGRYQEAEIALGQAAALMQQIPSGPAQTLYRADWEADRSTLLARQGHLPGAIAQLERASDVLALAGGYDARQRHFTELASLELQAGDSAAALRVASLATRDAEGGLGEAHEEVQKLAWKRDNGRGYRVSVEALLASGRTEEALRAWEWYRSAPSRPGIVTWKEGMPQWPVLPGGRRRGLLLVVARLEQQYVVWSVSEGAGAAVRVETASGPAEQIELMSAALWELCANRDSSQETIRMLGGRLYRTLFEPFDEEIRRNAFLQVELDPALRQLPLAALTQRGRSYLGLEHAIDLLPPWWVVRTTPEQPVAAHPRVLLVEGSNSIVADGHVMTLPDEYLETQNLAAIYPQARVLRGGVGKIADLKERMESSEVIHFSGHTAENGGETGVLFSAPDVVIRASSLHGISLRSCRLAVLASCSSAHGSAYDLEDMGSLSHALLRAGAGNVVATLWDVDSQASRDLMVAFHISLQHSEPPAFALRAAQRELHRVSATEHPFFWAAPQVFTQ